MCKRKAETVQSDIVGNYPRSKLPFHGIGIVFTTGVSFKQTFVSLHGQALKSVYKLKSVLNKFPCITVSHKLDLFDKFITPILGFCSEVWGYLEAA